MNATHAVGQPAPSTTSSTRRVNFLDGLRGVAALYVVVAHALSISLPETASAARGVFSTGTGLDRALYVALDSSIVFSRYGVVLFIVISGCSLMLPVARSAEGRLPGGFRTYVKRRAQRILPPYYAALGISLALIAVVPDMGRRVIPWWDGALPAFEPDVILSHVLLIHNWSPEWAYRINPPLWTIPIEWQIYFLFPLVLLPVLQRLGSLALIAVTFSTGLGLYVLVGPEQLVQSAPWFIGLFGLGMVAASVGFSDRQSHRLRSLPIATLIGVSLAIFVVAALLLRMAGVDYTLAGWLTDVIFGVAAALFIVHCARGVQQARGSSLALRALERRPVVVLGWFSYSLYLMHAPILMLLALSIRELDLPAWLYVPTVLLGVLLALIGTYVFHLLFERPFMPRHLRDVTGNPSDHHPGPVDRFRSINSEGVAAPIVRTYGVGASPEVDDRRA